MNINDSDEFKVLIDALKYTSNIIVNITNKLSEQDEKINKLENTINKIYKIITSEESKIDIFMDKKNLSNSDIKKFKKFNNNITEDYSDNELDSFILEKKNINTKNIKTKNTDIKNINTKNINTKNIDSSIFKEKNKIDKLITSIIKRKKILSDIMENNKEKSLLTEHNIINSNSLNEINNKIITEPTIEFSINTAKTSCHVDTKTASNINKEDEPKEEINKIDILKHIRKKTNFAKRF